MRTSAMSPLQSPHSYKIPALQRVKSQLSLHSLWLAFVFAALIALIGKLEIQREHPPTNRLSVPSQEHFSLVGGPEDASHLLQAVKPLVEYAKEDKSSSDSQDKDHSSSKNPLGSMWLGKDIIHSKWVSLAARTSLINVHFLTGGKTICLVVLCLLCLGFIGAVYAQGLKEVLRDPSEFSAPLRESPVDKSAPAVRQAPMKQASRGSSPSTPSISEFHQKPDVQHPRVSASSLDRPKWSVNSLIGQTPSPNPIPRLANSNALPRFPPHLGVPLRQVIPFDANANHEMTIVNLTNARTGHGKPPLMWARIQNTPDQRLLQIFTETARREPQVRIVSISRPGAFEIIAGGVSYGFLEAENSGRCSVFHKGDNVMLVEGEGSTRAPEIAVKSKREQVAGLRCNQDYDEPYMEFAIKPGEDEMLIVAVVLAVMLLAPASWKPRQAHVMSM